MDLVSTTIIAALVAGYLLDKVRELTSARRKALKPLKAVCSCDHAYGAHYDGRCHAEVKRDNGWKWDKDWNQAEPISWEYVPCPCRAYVGPQPVEVMGTLVLPELPAPVDLRKKELG